MTQAYVGLALGRGLGAGPCLIWLVDGPIGIEEARRKPASSRSCGVKNCVKKPMAIRMGADSRLQLDDHLVGWARLKYDLTNSFRRPRL